MQGGRFVNAARQHGRAMRTAAARACVRVCQTGTERQAGEREGGSCLGGHVRACVRERGG